MAGWGLTTTPSRLKLGERTPPGVSAQSQGDSVCGVGNAWSTRHAEHTSAGVTFHRDVQRSQHSHQLRMLSGQRDGCCAHVEPRLGSDHPHLRRGSSLCNRQVGASARDDVTGKRGPESMRPAWSGKEVWQRQKKVHPGSELLCWTR